MSSAFEATIEVLRERLAAPLPGASAQIRMAPPHPEVTDRLSVRNRSCREAAVLALLTPRDGEAHLLMTVRPSHLSRHAGQVSFPGGARERNEELRETAVRETHEEIGLEPAAIVLLGNLTPLYVPPSNFCVYPFVGITAGDPDLLPHNHEVEKIVHVPLSVLRRKDIIRTEERLLRGARLMIPYYEIQGLTVWGATAMMIAELLALFD